MPRQQQSGSNESAQLSVRCDADLKQRYSDVLDSDGRSMSDDLRDHMEAVVAAQGDDPDLGYNDELPDDENLRRAYHVLAEYCDPDSRTIDVEAADTIVADETNTPKKVVRDRIIKPLEARGLVRPHWGEIIVASVDGGN